MRPHRKQSGFGIMEVVIAMGLLGILSLGLMSIISNTNKSQAQAQAKFSFTSIAKDLQTQLQNEVSCTNSLLIPGGLDPNRPEEVAVKLGSTLVKEGALLENYSKLNVTRLRLQNIHPEGPSASGGVLYSADLFLGATSSNKFEFKPILVSRVMLATNSLGRFVQCGSGGAGAGGGGNEAEICKSLGGTYDVKGKPACQLGAAEKEICEGMGGAYNAKASPACKLDLEHESVD